MRWRTRLLTMAGGSVPVRWWLQLVCGREGVAVKGVPGAVEFRRGDEVVRVAPKHALLGPGICRQFECFANGVEARLEGGLKVADLAADPDRFNMCRACAAFGAVLEELEGTVRLRKGTRCMLLSRERVLYAPYLAEHFAMYFDPLVPEERGGMEVLDFSRPGILQTYKRTGLQFEMASFPEEEEMMEDYFRWYRPKQGDVVFDVGAHCGVSSYLLSKMVGDEGRVVCFEPDPVNFGLLERNIARHGLKNVTAVKAAIAGERGEVAFSSEGTIGSMVGSLLTRESAGEMVTVEAWTLGDAYERFGVPALCKIDIEGAEIEVVRRSADVLQRHRTNLVLDTSHLKADGTSTAAEVDAMLRSYGYEVLTEATPMLTTWARGLQPEAVRRS